MDLQNITIHKDKKPIYNIYFSNDFGHLDQVFDPINLEHHKICIVTDSNVGPLYAQELQKALYSFTKDVEIFTFPAGEGNKNLETVGVLYETLIKNQFDRNDLLIALGGGVVGDLTGYVAATYLRGIDFVQIPTSLLAMVDSSIGGKTGVDYKGYKNMVGAFKQPKAVYMNFNLLKSLPQKQFYSGFGEIIKHGLILDFNYFTQLESLVIPDFDNFIDWEPLHQIIIHSCELKQSVVEIDPLEKRERALLNYGHTIGHALEKQIFADYLHGECISLGIMAAAHISLQRHTMTLEDYTRIESCLSKFHLPTTLKGNGIYQLDAVKTMSFTKNDKKMSGGTIRFILLNKLGEAYIDSTVSDDEIIHAIESLID